MPLWKTMVVSRPPSVRKTRSLESCGSELSIRGARSHTRLLQRKMGVPGGDAPAA
jgi:hypothetical protein